MRVAVIGAGISGMGAALALSKTADVTLFEKDPRFGGHADTAQVALEGRDVAVDTGFIVFNDRNYPNLCALFDHLEVPSEDSNMTFSLSQDQGRIEYACDSLDKVFAQKWRALDPRFLRVFAEIIRFMKIAPPAADNGALDGKSLKTWLDEARFSQRFRENFLYPMGGAIWSTASADIGDFPAASFVEFFRNHELLRAFDRRIQWRTVSGGSRVYVRKLLTALGPRAVAGVGATQVRRRADGLVVVRFDDGSEAVYDHVVLACHSDQSLGLLADADPEERAVLSSVRYSDNAAYLHADPALMPRRRKVWSSWNFLSQTGAEDRPPAVSYWMNRLQNIETRTPLIVTLNPPTPPREELTFARRSYAHPQFDAAALAAQRQIDSIQGRRGVWFAGAWLGWGFHEDGLRSGLRVAEALGARPDWSRIDGAPLRAAPVVAAA